MVLYNNNCSIPSTHCHVYTPLLATDDALQSAYYSEAVTKAHIPFMLHTILECDHNGLEYTLEDHDITLKIPEGAVAMNQTIHIEIGVTMFGQFIFPKDAQPISPIVWLCLLEENTKLIKPFQLILPHLLAGLTRDELHNHQIVFVKASHCSVVKGSVMKYQFNPCDSEPLFASSGDRSYAVLELEHCCFYCLQANQTRELVKNFGYYLTRVEHLVSPRRNEIYFLGTYCLKTCIQVISLSL